MREDQDRAAGSAGCHVPLLPPARFGKARRSHALSYSDWERLEDALIEARFWWFDQYGRAGHVLDRASWSNACSRGRDYHCISRHRPSGPLYDVGVLLLDFAGLHDVRL